MLTRRHCMHPPRHFRCHTLVYVLSCAFAVALVFHLGARWARVEQSNALSYLSDEAPVKLRNANDKRPKLTKTFYPERSNMGPCPRTFGNVMIFVAVLESSYKTHYHVAQQSLQCYLKSTNYTLKLVDLDKDEKVNQNCKHDQIFFKKHYTGVVNPNHCIEEWIDDRVDLIFYERFFNWEIASGNYLVRNTEFAREFLMKWANWQYMQPQNWNGADNGVLQIHILQTVFPDAIAETKACDAIWHRATGYETYLAYVVCIKGALGVNRLFPGKLRIFRRAHGWVRDGFITSDGWCERDFMLHGWKHQEINIDGWSSPFTKMFNTTECGREYSGWHWRNEKRLGADAIRIQLSNFERSSGRTYPPEARVHAYLSEPDVGECYPNCDKDT